MTEADGKVARKATQNTCDAVVRMPGAVMEGWSRQELSLSEADILAVREKEIEHER